MIAITTFAAAEQQLNEMFNTWADQFHEVLVLQGLDEEQITHWMQIYYAQMQPIEKHGRDAIARIFGDAAASETLH
jgi:hypothetical protein